MSCPKGRHLLIADKVANTDEKSIAALNCGKSWTQPAEKSLGQVRAQELNRPKHVTALVEIQFHQEKLFGRSITNATGSASGNGGQP